MELKKTKFKKLKDDQSKNKKQVYFYTKINFLIKLD